MKSLLQEILDGLTYKDLAGQRQPRAYTVITGILLLLLFMVAGVALLNRILVMRTVRETTKPVNVTAQATNVTPFRQAAQTTPMGCPTDPEKWSLVSVYDSLNYDLIQPACVYQGLERTIAWALAIREGYSRAEATQGLGFTEMPMRRLDQVTIPAKANGLAAIPVSFIPPDPDFTEWRLNSNGEAAVTYALRGCFRTSTIVGNQVQVWGGEYPIICMVVEDAENTHIVYSLDGHVFTTPATPMRSFLLFGYVADGNWVWLGTQDDPKLEITDPHANAHERLTIATLYDSKPWDPEWLQNSYHLWMKTLPENWQTMTDKREQQAILNELSVDPNGVKP
jgi:hypothetical protein